MQVFIRPYISIGIFVLMYSLLTLIGTRKHDTHTCTLFDHNSRPEDTQPADSGCMPGRMKTLHSDRYPGTVADDFLGLREIPS